MFPSGAQLSDSITIGKQFDKKRRQRYTELLHRFYDRSPSRSSCFTAIYWLIRRMQFAICYQYTDPELDEFEESFRPPHLSLTQLASVDELCHRTGLHRNQIRYMYRQFKQRCPTGYMRRDDLVDIFNCIFVKSIDSSSYANRIYRAIDIGDSKMLRFDVLMSTIVDVIHSSNDVKVSWIYRIMDANDGKGKITYKQFIDYVRSIYNLRTNQSNRHLSTTDENNNWSHTFKEMDIDGDGFISPNDFHTYISQNEYKLNLA